MNIRKSVNSLSAFERERYVSALLKLKNTPSPISGRTYDDYVRWHQESWFYNTFPITGMPDVTPFYSYAHGCSGFLPWHRQYLRLLELDLQAVICDEELSLPYWDWSADATLDDPTQAPVWSEEFMGGNGDESNDWRVSTGPFSYREGRWPLQIKTPYNTGGGRLEIDKDLRRNFGGNQRGHLPSVAEIQAVLLIESFDSAPYNRTATGFRSSHERNLHNLPHMWVGGSMMSATSPNDPSFFLHHANVDRIWSKWQDLYPNQEYVPKTPVEIVGQSINEEMVPFHVEVESVIDYRAMGFEYDGKASDDQVTPVSFTAETIKFPEPEEIINRRPEPFE